MKIGISGSLPPFFPIYEEANVISQIFSSVLEKPFTFQQDFILIPELVDKFSILPNEKTVLFHFRKDVLWSDGKPFSAKDYLFTFEFINSNRQLFPEFDNYICNIEGVDLLNDNEVRVRYKDQLCTVLRDASFSPMPVSLYQSLLKDGTLSIMDWNESFILNATGPYSLAIDKDHRIILRKNPHYYQRNDGIKEIQVMKFDDVGKALESFQMGDVHMLIVDREIYRIKKRDANFRKIAKFIDEPGFEYIAILWNLDSSNPFFCHPLVRKALAYGTNLKGMYKKTLDKTCRICTSPFHPRQFWFNKDIKPIPYDCKRAKELLEQAGWIYDKEKKVRCKDGLEFSFELIVPTGEALDKAIAEYLAQNFKKLGINVSISILNWAVYLDRLYKGQFQAALVRNPISYHPFDAVKFFYSDPEKGNKNYNRYCNSEVDQLFYQAKDYPDYQEAKEIYRQIQRIIYQDQPCLFLFYSGRYYLVRKELGDINSLPYLIIRP